MNNNSSFKFVDKRGQNQAALYPTPSSIGRIGKYRPRLIVVGDTPKVQTQYNRYDQMGYARDLFASLPDLGGAVMSKAAWCVNNGFSPVYNGKNKAWGDEAETWLMEQFYPICNVLGPNFDFQTSLYLSSVSLDVDGDTAMILTTTRSGYPQVQLIPSHRIGQRKDEKLVAEGKFSGYRIFDGVILNDNGRPIGYRILGDTVEEDQDISAANMQLLFEPEWGDQVRGISRIARSTLDWLDSQDIDEYTKRGIKQASSIGLIHTTETGTVDSGANFVGAQEDIITGETSRNLTMEYIQGGEVYYMKAGIGEDIKTLLDQRPSPNTEAFMARIQRRAMYAVGWHVELLDPSKVGGASVRLIQDLARKSVASRQTTLEKRAKYIVNFAITKAMNAGLIPQNNDDWFKWTFTKGSVISVDNGNEASADREAFKLGMTTLQDITSKGGKDWFNVREQSQKEVEDLLDRVNLLMKKYNLPFETCLTLLQQSTPNQAPVGPVQTINKTEQPIQ